MIQRKMWDGARREEIARLAIMTSGLLVALTLTTAVVLLFLGAV